MDKKISQSFLKDYNEYKGKNLCGVQLKAKHFDNVQFPSSEAMDLGNYFEYMATGSLPRSGIVPQPRLSYAGTKREKISTPFERALESAELFKKIQKQYDLKINDIGLKLSSEYKNGILDIWGEMNGRPCIVDLKYSGLIDDKWSETGWDVESLHYKERLIVQAVQYKMLVKENYNIEYKDFDFYFMVFSSKEVNNVKLIRVNIDEDAFNVHQSHIESVYKQINAMDIEKDFVAYPSLKRCSKCPLYNDCEFKSDIPLIEDVYYG
jgi:NADPH-dependent 7-cyano-7-deazaguanine reductase QueF-like protein